MSTPAKKKLGNLFEIGRQVDLPLSKIGDIAWRNMKHRFGRSIVTTSGVILATAFLMAMLIKNSMVGSMLQATRSLKSVQLDQPLSARQAHDIVTVLNDQHQGFDQTLQDYTDVLTDNKNSLKVQKAVVQQCIADLKDCSLSPGKAKPGQELAFHQKTEQLLQAKNDLQSDETSLAAQQEQVDIAQAVVDRANRLLKTAAPGYVFSAKANAPGAGSATEDVEFLHRQGNMLEHELQSRAIQDEGTAPAAAAAAAAPAGAASPKPPPAAVKNEEAPMWQSPRDLWLTGLALIVAGVGITNAMLMSVTERFREIGTMKCLGALDGFIMKLFLIESAVQGGLGTILGIVIGALMMVVYLLINFGASLVTVYWPWGPVGLDLLMAFLAGVAISVVGAAFPSLYASRMDPIAAMRQEI